MPRNHAGRRVQLRKLKWQFCNTPATGVEILGVPKTPTVRETQKTSKFGHTVVPGEWVAPRRNQAPEIDGKTGRTHQVEIDSARRAITAPRLR